MGRDIGLQKGAQFSASGAAGNAKTTIRGNKKTDETARKSNCIGPATIAKLNQMAALA
jgi:hypothetical protein